MSDSEKATLFERLGQGLKDGMAYSRGELTLRTTELPAPPPQAGADQIVRLRKRLRMSQAVFAATLNVSPKTVQSWEQGIRQPADAALRMLQVIRERPQVIRAFFADPQPAKGRAHRGRQRKNGAVRKIAG